MRSIRSGPSAALLVAGVLLALSAPPAPATSILPQDLGVLAGESTHIVRGTVLSIDSRWNDDHTLIVTEIRLGVRETFRGRGRAEITLELPGGQVGDVILDVVGMPGFELDEDVVVFAAPGPGGRLHLPSLAQSKYRVEQDADGSLWVSNRQYPLELLLPDQAAALDAGGRLPWQAFAGRLRAELAGGGR